MSQLMASKGRRRGPQLLKKRKGPGHQDAICTGGNSSAGVCIARVGAKKLDKRKRGERARSQGTSLGEVPFSFDRTLALGSLSLHFLGEKKGSIEV